MSNEKITFTDVRLTFGTQNIFNGLNVSFTENGISFLVGPNGAGKTQLLRAIHGLTLINSGDISAPKKKTQAFLSQQPLLLNRSVEKNLFFIRGTEVSPKSYFDQHIGKVIESFNLEPLLKKSANCLSGGQKKRITIARLLLQKADYYLLDELTANMDASTNSLIEAAIAELADKGKKIIIATHDLLHLERLLIPSRDEILLIDRGKLVKKANQLNHLPIKSYL